MGSYNYGIAPMKFTTVQQSGYAQQMGLPQQRDYEQQGGGAHTYGPRPRHHRPRGPQQGSQFGAQNGFAFGGAHGRPGFSGYGQQNVAWGGGAQGGFGGWQRLTSTQHADRMFGQFDTNADGSITRDEMVAALDAMRGAASTSTATSTSTVDATTTSTDITTVDATTPTTETTVDASVDTSTDAAAEAALAELIASTDTSTIEVPVAPTVDDSTAGSVV